MNVIAKKKCVQCGIDDMVLIERVNYVAINYAKKF
jgi:hypothetical protein